MPQVIDAPKPRIPEPEFLVPADAVRLIQGMRDRALSLANELSNPPTDPEQRRAFILESVPRVAAVEADVTETRALWLRMAEMYRAGGMWIHSTTEFRSIKSLRDYHGRATSARDSLLPELPSLIPPRIAERIADLRAVAGPAMAVARVNIGKKWAAQASAWVEQLDALERAAARATWNELLEIKIN